MSALFALALVAAAATTTPAGADVPATAVPLKRAAVTTTVQDAGTPYELFGVSFATPREGHLVGAGGTILASTDGGTTWTPQHAPVVVSPEGLGELLAGVSFPNARNGHIAGLSGSILATTDEGATWTTQQPPAPVEVGGQLVSWAFNAVSFIDPAIGYMVGGRSGILRTVDGGASWRVVADARYGNLMDVVAVDRLNGQAVGWSGQVADGIPFVSLATTDGGVTWEPRFGQFKPGVASLNFNGVSFVDPMHGWAVGDEGRIVVTADGGRTWTLQHSGAVENLTGVSFLDTRRGVAVGTLGLNTGAQKAIVYATDDGGQTWVTRFVPDTVRLRGGVDFADRSTAYAVGCRRDAPGTNTGAPEQPTCEAGAVARIQFLAPPAPSSGSSGSDTLVLVLVVVGGAVAVVGGGAVVARRRGTRS